MLPAVAVMVASPGARAVITPFATLTMSLSPLVQLTVLFVAVSGATTAVRVRVSPTSSVSALLSSVTPLTGTVLTVTAQVAVLP